MYAQTSKDVKNLNYFLFYTIYKTKNKSTMAMIYSMILILASFVAVKSNSFSPEEVRVGQNAVYGMYKYMISMFPTECPTQVYPIHSEKTCDVITAYKEFSQKEDDGNFTTEYQANVTYNSWGETPAPSEKINLLFGFMVAIGTLIVCCNRRPLTAEEMFRINRDPIFRYKYMSGRGF